ncbi:13343_t:CDS:2, partial [Entrophospora sp. SA101]
FVNGLVDPIQQNYYAISISTLAGQLNLPLWFVELRHASTHQDLPSLNVLRNASKQALKWLSDNYWTSQKPLKSTHIDEITKLIIQYKDERKNYLKLSSTIPNLSEELINLWLPMLKKFDETWSNFIDELVEEMLEILVNNEDYYKDKILPKLSSSRLPSHKSISSYFLTIVEWINYFIKHYHNKNSEHFKDLDLDYILEFCLRKPNKYTRLVLLSLVEYDEKLKSNSRPFLSYIDKLVEDAHNNDNDNDGNNNNLENHNIGTKLTDEEMKNEISKLENNLILILKRLYSSDSHQKISNYSSSSPSTSSMVLFNPEEWNPCPIGCLVNGQVPCLDLPLELDDNNDDDSNFF